jgi:hypothetical protein
METKKRKVSEAGAIKISKQKNKDLADKFKIAITEADVNPLYRAVCQHCIEDLEIVSYGRTDGILKSKKHDLLGLMECKYKQDISDRRVLCTLLVQVVYYLHAFEERGDMPPKVLLVGDQKECFVLPSAYLEPYVAMADVDWTKSPSEAAKYNGAMIKKMMDDENIHPFVFNFEKSDFDFTEVVDSLLDYNKTGPVKLVQITPQRIHDVFQFFISEVLQEEMGPSEQVGLFVHLLIDPINYELHPKKNTILTGSKEIKCDKTKFKSLFGRFNRNLTRQEKDEIVRICDRLLEDEKRRREGAFFTPTLWVDKAHEIISEKLGDNWRKDYVVWDCAAGTGNLTADYKFKELYVSTLVKEEIDMQISSGTNSTANRFTYDFLGEEGINKVPDVLRQTFEAGKKVMFFINPPYKTANDLDAIHHGGSSKDVSKTVVNTKMANDKVGPASQQLYAQFLYKILLLQKQYGNKIAIALFCPPLFMSGEHYEGFRKLFLDTFEYTHGMLFQASEFADVKAQWGISFTIWES